MEKNKLIYATNLWGWIDRVSTESQHRLEEIKELGAAGQLRALEEAGFRRALDQLMDQVLDEDNGLVTDAKTVVENYVADEDM